MTSDDRPSAVDRRLTDEARNLMRQLAIWSVAEQTGVDAEEATRALDANEYTWAFVASSCVGRARNLRVSALGVLASGTRE